MDSVHQLSYGVQRPLITREAPDEREQDGWVTTGDGDGVVRGRTADLVGQGDSDKPRAYRYSTVERADLVQALWRYHGVRRTVVATFDYTSLALLELLRRQLDSTMATPAITAALMVNGGLFADAHTHLWQTTPVLRTPLGALGMRRAHCLHGRHPARSLSRLCPWWRLPS